MLLYGADKDVADWVSKQLLGEIGYFGECRAIGVVVDNRLIAGVVYNNYRESPKGTPLHLEMSIASIDKRWATRQNIRALFKYPFIDLDVKRVNTHCSTQAEGVIKFNYRLGFTLEGLHPKLFEDGDAYSWGMLKEKCKWISSRSHRLG